MNVYFVRHGESDFNAKRAAQPPTSKLTELGQAQAHTIAERFVHMPVDCIVSSPFERAHHTATIIQEKISHVPLVLSDFFTEQKRPTSIIGKSYDDEILKKTYEAWREHAHEPEWHYEDEENFHDLKTRAEQALQYLTSLGHEHVAVVTHGNFLKFLFATILFGEELTVKEYAAITRALFPSNTGLTVCHYHKEGKRWQVITWNDLAHLAE